MREKLTVIVPTYNEEKNIEACLKSLTFADEIIVVDSFSTDKTKDIALKFTDNFIEHEYVYSTKQKNWIIPKAKYKWILLVDADERVDEKLKNEILSVLENAPTFDAYWIRRRNFISGREIKHGAWGRDKVIRLFKRDRCRYEDKEVHGEIIVDGKTGKLKNKLIHYTYNNVDEYISKLIRYSVWGANQRYKEGWKGSLINVIFQPPFIFFKNYILYLGFLDGIDGFIVEILNSYYVLLKYIRLWEKTSKLK